MIASKTAAEFNAEAAQHDRNAQESFDRCDTDGFLSQWASGINSQKASRNAQIAARGGTADFWAFTVTDLEGNPLNFRRAETRFGFKLVIEFPNGNEVWIDPYAKRPATNANKGVIVGRREFTAPAHAATWSPQGARGMGGCASVQVVIFPDDRTLKYDGVTL